jgi:hypothetical protein
MTFNFTVENPIKVIKKKEDEHLGPTTGITMGKKKVNKTISMDDNKVKPIKGEYLRGPVAPYWLIIRSEADVKAFWDSWKVLMMTKRMNETDAVKFSVA